MDETYDKLGPRCPYCLHLHQPDAPEFYRDTDAFECDRCGKEFEMEVFTSTSWTCTPSEARDGKD